MSTKEEEHCNDAEELSGLHPNYKIFEKRYKNISVHCFPAFETIKEGDIVTVGQCRPFFKAVRLNALKVQPKQIF